MKRKNWVSLEKTRQLYHGTRVSKAVLMGLLETWRVDHIDNRDGTHTIICVSPVPSKRDSVK